MPEDTQLNLSLTLAGISSRLPGRDEGRVMGPLLPPSCQPSSPLTGPCVHRMWSSLNEWLWHERFWLPPNHTWAELEDPDGLVYAHPRDMLAALPLALALVAVRLAFER